MNDPFLVPGAFVRLPGRPDWGIGQVQSVIGRRVTANFENAGKLLINGDVVILKRTETADSGDIVVALIDAEEATLKRLRKRGNSVALEAANPNYETRLFGPDRVRIQGKMVALVRRYS